MKVNILLFATLREKLKKEQFQAEADDGMTVAELTQRILEPIWEDREKLPPLLYAVNCQYVPQDYLLKPGDELALIPPVAGG